MRIKTILDQNRRDFRAIYVTSCNYYEVEFKDGMWLAFEISNFRHGTEIVSEYNMLPGCLPRFAWDSAEVVGNIHENPELMEVDK